jgi:hypothetical protein
MMLSHTHVLLTRLGAHAVAGADWCLLDRQFHGAWGFLRTVLCSCLYLL